MNEATAISDADVQVMIPALAQQWNSDLVPVWGVDPVNMTWFDKSSTPSPGMWWCVFLDDSDQADALAYHDLTSEGLPIAKVFAKTILADNALVSVGASHELLEMAVDPWLNSAYQGPDGRFWAGEIADPVEDDQYAYDGGGGIMVSNFVTPNWFGHQNAGVQVDLKNVINKSFAIASGGYAQWFDPSHGWQQITGNAAAQHARILTAPQGSRRWMRAMFRNPRQTRHMMRSHARTAHHHHHP
jgi:hypothetical protein